MKSLSGFKYRKLLEDTPCLRAVLDLMETSISSTGVLKSRKVNDESLDTDALFTMQQMHHDAKKQERPMLKGLINSQQIKFSSLSDIGQVINAIKFDEDANLLRKSRLRGAQEHRKH